MSNLISPFFKYEIAIENKEYVEALKILQNTSTPELKRYRLAYIIEPHLEQFYDLNVIQKSKKIKANIDNELAFRETHNVSSSNTENPFTGKLKPSILLYGTLALIGVFVFSKTKNR